VLGDLSPGGEQQPLDLLGERWLWLGGRPVTIRLADCPGPRVAGLSGESPAEILGTLATGLVMAQAPEVAPPRLA
jgi:hypothetical protein